MIPKLHKTTIIIWSKQSTADMDLPEIGYAAFNGNMYCSKHESELVPDPLQDPDFDGTEFFETGDHE